MHIIMWVAWCERQKFRYDVDSDQFGKIFVRLNINEGLYKYIQPYTVKFLI